MLSTCLLCSTQQPSRYLVTNFTNVDNLDVTTWYVTMSILERIAAVSTCRLHSRSMAVSLLGYTSAGSVAYVLLVAANRLQRTSILRSLSAPTLSPSHLINDRALSDS